MRALLAAALLAATGLIWFAVDQGWTAGVDRALLLAMAGGPVRLWQAVTFTGDTTSRIGIALVVVALLLWRGRRGDALLLALTVGGGLGLNAIAKEIVDRPRPGLLPHLDTVGVLSFPSGHSAGAMILGLGLALLARERRWIVAGLAYAGAVGLSRLALAVHWPSDVAAGWCLGAAWVLALSAAARRWRRATDR